MIKFLFALGSGSIFVFWGWVGRNFWGRYWVFKRLLILGYLILLIIYGGEERKY